MCLMQVVYSDIVVGCCCCCWADCRTDILVKANAAYKGKELIVKI